VLQGQVDVRQGDSRKPLPAGQAAFVPSKQIHGTVTTGTGTAILISFQCPPDLELYTGARDSSRPGAAAPVGVITPGAVQLLHFPDKNGFFTYPQMGSKCVAAAHRKMQSGDRFTAESAGGGEEFLFVWKGSVTVNWNGNKQEAGERDTVFIQGAARPEVSNHSQGEAIVIQVQAPPASGGN
jgi:mannose-6-phosphate isomerase-like protein (cupin superfamily)